VHSRGRNNSWDQLYWVVWAGFTKHSTNNILGRLTVDENPEGQEMCFCGASVKVKGATKVHAQKFVSPP